MWISVGFLIPNINKEFALFLSLGIVTSLLSRIFINELTNRAFGARWCRGFRWTPKGKVWLLDCTTNWFSAFGKTQIIFFWGNFQLEFYKTIFTIQRIYIKKKESRIKALRFLLMPFFDFKYFHVFVAEIIVFVAIFLKKLLFPRGKSLLNFPSLKIKMLTSYVKTVDNF